MNEGPVVFSTAQRARLLCPAPHYSRWDVAALVFTGWVLGMLTMLLILLRVTL